MRLEVVSWLQERALRGGLMRKRMLAAAAIVCAASMAIGAQAPSPQQQAPGESPDRVTVTGCLQPAPQSQTEANSPPPDAKANSTGKGFVLTDTTAGPANAPDESKSVAKTYRLVANDSALSPHAGKKVELTGTVQDQDSSARSENPAPPDAAPSAAGAGGPRLVVESGKVLSVSCAQ
jgi:hypothetical protein